MLRVLPGGRVTFIVEYDHSKKIRIGSLGILKPNRAKEEAMKILGDYANGLAPNQSREKQIESAAMKKIVSTEQ